MVLIGKRHIQVFDKLKEELEELEVEIKHSNKDKIENELGDVFFSLINYARFLKVNPEKCPRAH